MKKSFGAHSFCLLFADFRFMRNRQTGRKFKSKRRKLPATFTCSKALVEISVSRLVTTAF